MQSFLKQFAIAAMATTLTVAGAMAAEAPAKASSRAAPTASKFPRLANGKPNLNGIWQVMNTANYDLEPHAARAALALVPGPFNPVPAPQVVALGAVGAVPAGLGVVDGDQIPYKPEALPKKQENQKNWLTSDPEIKCYLPGVPRATYMPYPFQIFQSRDYVLIAYEYAGAVRNIYMKDPGPPPADSWMGQSVGRWEGDTLVVEVTGFNDQTWFDRAGNYHSDALRVVERYTPRTADMVWYEATIEDKNVFTRPWKISMPLYRRLEPNATLMQFKCVEFVEELMYGDLRKQPLAAPESKEPAR
jgi:hypothetical protein